MLRWSERLLWRLNLRFGLGRRHNFSWDELFRQVRIVTSNFLLLWFLDFFTEDLDIRIGHSVLLLRQKIIYLWSSCHASSSWANASCTHCISTISNNLALRVFKLGDIHWIFLSRDRLEYWNRKWSGKWLIGFAWDGEFNIINVYSLLLIIGLVVWQSSVLAEYLSFLENFGSIVIHKLKELVYHVFLIVFDSY
jgi:hypothetical protein